MRIKEEIKRSGRFWLPSTPERDIYGTLFISDGGNIKLELTQPIDTNLEAVFGQTEGINRILGHVEKEGHVLIDNIYRIQKQRNIVHGQLIAPDIIFADRLLTSFPCDENPNLLFNTYSFSVEGIDEWVGMSSITVEDNLEEKALTISYKRPSNIVIELTNGMHMHIIFDHYYRINSIVRKAEVTQKIYFKLDSEENRELDEFVSVGNMIAGFLCFVMNKIVSIDNMSTTSESLQQDFGDGRTSPITVGVYNPTWPYAKNEPDINEFDMLFKFTDYEQRFESMINLWIENYDEISPALDLFFLTKTGTLPNVDIHFLTLAQSLEAFHRRTSKEKHMVEDEFQAIRKTLIKECPKIERNWFGSKLHFANELTLRNRLEKLTDPFENYMCGENRAGMINKIVKTRHYRTHLDPELEQEAAKGKTLGFLCTKMNTLFRLQFLKLIGFTVQEIDEIVDKCPYFKGTCNL